jgi:hypothetical protein
MDFTSMPDLPAAPLPVFRQREVAQKGSVRHSPKHRAKADPTVASAGANGAYVSGYNSGGTKQAQHAEKQRRQVNASCVTNDDVNATAMTGLVHPRFFDLHQLEKIEAWRGSYDSAKMGSSTFAVLLGKERAFEGRAALARAQRDLPAATDVLM